MGLQTFTPRRNLGTADTSRLPSPNIWGDCPWNSIIDGTVGGIAFADDFENVYFTNPTTEAVFPPYKGFGSTGGTIKPATHVRYGTITLGSDGDNEGSSISQVAAPFKIIRADGPFWFECRVKFDTIADTKYGVFLGLYEPVAMTATVPIAADGTLADGNFVGFHRLEGDGDYVDCVYKANGVTQVTKLADAQVLVADTYVKLGMKFGRPGDPTNYNFSWYGNNLLLKTYEIPSAAGTDFPNDVVMGMLAALLNAAAATSVFSMDWWRVAQLDEA